MKNPVLVKLHGGCKMKVCNTRENYPITPFSSSLNENNNQQALATNCLKKKKIFEREYNNQQGLSFKERFRSANKTFS